MPEAVDDVVVDEAACLHQRVADRRPDEAEATPFQLLRHRARLVRLGRELGRRPPAIDPGLAADERPEQLVEAAGGDRRLRVRDRRLDLQPVADDARVGEQPLDVAWAESGDCLDGETGERAPVTGPLVQDRRPRQPGLGALEDEQLEEMPLVVRRDAPFLVVVGEVERVAFRRPRATGAAAQSGAQSTNRRGRSSLAVLPLLPRAVTSQAAQRSSDTAVKVVVKLPVDVTCTRSRRRRPARSGGSGPRAP
jgi:hypothetical protein